MNAQQLRNSILQEAIEGRLVPQDPNDEPASVLLERIREEKKRLVNEGKLKKKDLEETPISEDEKPFEIPESWEWVRISDISESFIGLTYKPTDVSTNGWIVLRSSNIQEGILDYNDIVKVNVEVSEKLRVRVNDIIICARNGSKKLVGKSALVREVNEPTTFGAFMAICRTQFYEYIAKYLLSPLFFQQLRKDSATTTINQLTQKNFNRYLVPLPPLAEQKRIVAKIEELLPKVEEYGKAQEALNKLNEELPERLKKSVLQEAISGKLVPQDPNDEPASVLLKRIREEKKRLVKEGKLKKKDLEETPISEDEIPFDIPDSWKWVRLNTLFSIFTGKKDANFGDSNGTYDFFTCSNTPIKSLTYSYDGEYLIMPGNGANIGQVIHYKGKFEAYQRTYLLQPYVTISLEYLKYHLLFNWKEYNRSKLYGSAIPYIKLDNLTSYLVATPPLAEQKRIVAKIEEAFKAIDALS